MRKKDLCVPPTYDDTIVEEISVSPYKMSINASSSFIYFSQIYPKFFYRIRLRLSIHTDHRLKWLPSCRLP